MAMEPGLTWNVKEGRLLLGGQYVVGQPLSPLHVVFPVSHAE